MRKILSLFLLSFALVSAPTTADSCPNSGLLSEKLFTKFCWDCLFPMRLGGVKVPPPYGSGSGARPDGSLSGFFCSCPGLLGIPEFGVAFSAWMPKFVTETVQKPYCSPGFGGMSLGGNTRLATGGELETRATLASRAASDSAFLNFHTYSFPLLSMLELFMESGCDPDGYVDIELQYISEPDPLWSDTLLAGILTPEAALFTNPAAKAVCAYECNEITAGGDGVEGAHWCAGCWGSVYPFSGSASAHGSDRVKHSSLITTKALAALHRRMLAYKSYGNDASCGERRFAPTLLKEQYRFGMFYPRPESRSNHKIGESTLSWGSNRTKAGAGSNHLYIGYRYQDCCMR